MPNGNQSGFDVNAARQSGYSDDEILAHLTQTRQFDINKALQAGYSKTDIIGYLSSAPAPQRQAGPAFTPPPGTPDTVAQARQAISNIVPKPAFGYAYTDQPNLIVPAQGGGAHALQAGPIDYAKLQAGAEAGSKTAFALENVPLAAANPGATAGAIGGGMAGQYGAKKIAQGLGASPQTADIAGDVGGAIGGLAGGYGASRLAAPVEAAASRLFGNVQKAGQLFDEVKAATSGSTVPVSDEMSEAASRIMELKERGAKGMPRVISTFVQRVTDPDKPGVSWNEARDFYSNVSRLSANEYQNMNPQMQAAVSRFAHAFNDTLQDTAAAAGKGEEYGQAMQLYRTAKSWQKFGADSWTFLKKAAPIAAGMGAGGRLALGHLLDMFE